MDLQDEPYGRCTAGGQGAISSRPAICRLSQDILILVFSILKDSTKDVNVRNETEHGGRIRWHWTVLTCVCQYWRNTALQYPPLWAHLPEHIFKHPMKMKMYIDRSKSADLTINAHIWRRNQVNNEELNSLMDALQHIHRVRCLTLNIHHNRIKDRSTWTQIQEALTRPSPRLRRLDLSASINISGEDVLFFGFPETSYNLKILNLRNFRLPLGLSFHSLTNLVELGLTRVKGLTPTSFLTILKSCPDLERLTLNRMLWDMDHEAPGTRYSSPGRVSLSKLIYLFVTVGENNRPGHEEIFRHLDIPPSASWLCCCSAVRKQSLLDMDFYSRLPVTDNLLSHEEVHLWISENSVLITSYDALHRGENWNEDTDMQFPKHIYLSDRAPSRSTTLSFNWIQISPFNQTYEQFQPLIPLYHGKSAKSLYFHLKDYHAIIEKESWVLTLLPHSAVQSLSIVGYEWSFRNIQTSLYALMHGNQGSLSSQSESDGIICPNLEHLHLTFPSKMSYADIPAAIIQSLKDVLQLRNQLGLRLKSLTIKEAEKEETPSTLEVSRDLLRATLSELVDQLNI